MGRLRHRTHLAADVAVVAVVAVLVLVLAALDSSGHGDSGPASATRVPSTAEFAKARRLPDGFLGLSLEYTAIEPYAGSNPAAINPVLVKLIRNLTPGQHPVLRIGGDSSDYTWWPVAGLTRPPGVRYALDRRWLAVTRALTRALGARLILDINFEADSSTLAGAEARALLAGLGRSSVRALELGNEPELYGAFPWYRTAAGRGVMGRPRSYNFPTYVQDFATIASALPSYPLAGPAVSGPGWLKEVPPFLRLESNIGLATVHRYPLQNCFEPQDSPRYPTVSHLLSNAASAGVARTIAPSAAIAHAHGVPLRIDEFNSVSCGASPAVSNSFASALWATDALFELAHAGIDGVNVHTFPGAGYELFKPRLVSGRWRVSVAPEYYGLLLFARAAPAGSRLVALPGSDRELKLWGAHAPGGRVTITLINKNRTRPRTVIVRARGAKAAARLELLQTASGAITLGGQSLGSQTETGAPSGPSTAAQLQPQAGGYRVSLPPASAALLTLPDQRG